MSSIEVDGLVYGEHMIRELLTRAEQAEAELKRFQRYANGLIGHEITAIVREAEREVSEEIAAWLEVNTGPDIAGSVCRNAARDIRTNAWRPSQPAPPEREEREKADNDQLVHDTAERIAAWLDRERDDVLTGFMNPTRSLALKQIADQLRQGAWREKASE